METAPSALLFYLGMNNEDERLRDPRVRRALALQGTALANAQVDTLRIKLLKVAAVVTRNTRRIRLYLASSWPSAPIFARAMSALRSP